MQSAAGQQDKPPLHAHDARPASIGHAKQLLFPGMLRLGMGCGDLYGGSSRRQSARLVEAALDAGIRYFDVARLYGNGSAETVVGSVLRRQRQRVILTSKAGILPGSMRYWNQMKRKATKAIRLVGPLGRALVPPPPQCGDLFGAFRARQLERSVHRSLRELQTEYLDILLLHECTLRDAHDPEVSGFLQRLRDQGKIRAFGIATHFADTCEILEQVPHVAPIAQFASDADNRNVTHLPRGRAELVITHTAIKRILPRLAAYLAGNSAAAVRWADRTGVAPTDHASMARLLLADAVAANANGIVLFSSSQPERISAAAASNFSPEALQALRAELACMHFCDAASS